MPSPSTSSGQTGGLPYDRLGAFCRENHAVLPGAGQGPLAGLTFAAKDVFDIAGSRIGFGNPAWLESHPPAAITAPAVQLLLDAGADMAGKTLTDEITYSLSGQNFHYGTPVNSAAPGRIPGGSSSGSASAVAGGLVDFALGTDCGGSVRLPASYCGILGIRPSHGRVSLEGVAPFTWSFDVAGWFARDADVFASVDDVLLDDESESHTPRRLLYALDAFDLVDRDVADALAPAVEAAAGVIGSRADITISPDGLPGWYETFRVIQAWEIWSNHAAWIGEAKPEFGPGIRERFEWASRVTQAEVEAARIRRGAIVERIGSVFEEGDVLCLPTSPRVAPPVDAPTDELENRVRAQAMSLLCVAGLAGLPQVSLPLASLGGLPLGFSLVGPRGTDRQLLALSQRLMART
ncbi:MAG: amidase [Chloroflexi bacterium]|nr:amidase [Chloroflexota bacterium]